MKKTEPLQITSQVITSLLNSSISDIKNELQENGTKQNNITSIIDTINLLVPMNHARAQESFASLIKNDPTPILSELIKPILPAILNIFDSHKFVAFQESLMSTLNSLPYLTLISVHSIMSYVIDLLKTGF
jgi:hypothetical protein